jgi:ankyrin repeat protein
MNAVAFGSLAPVQEWLDGGGNVELRGHKHNFTLLHIACENRQLAMIELLLDRGADMAARTIREDGVLGGNALGMASFKGEHAVVAQLIARGAELDLQTYRGSTALMGASKFGHWRVVNALLGAGASTLIKDVSGARAEAWARSSGQFAIARLLRRHAAVAPELITTPRVELANRRERAALLRGAELAASQLGSPPLHYWYYWYEPAAVGHVALGVVCAVLLLGTLP